MPSQIITEGAFLHLKNIYVEINQCININKTINILHKEHILYSV